MKKLISLILALMLVISLAAPAYAASAIANEETGSITINGVGINDEGELGSTFKIYKLLDLESYNKAEKKYVYKVNSDWAAFFATEDAKKYFTVDNQNYATWIGGDDAEATAAFAKIALAYAQANGISAVKSTENEGDYTLNAAATPATLKFSDLDLGYYLVDSTVGALCGLTTTNPDASINAKNGSPTIDKQVKEDGTGNWGDTNTADIGQAIEFRTTINVHAGAQNYVLHDTMTAGLTFNGVTLIEHISGSNTHPVPVEKYEVVTEGLSDGCTFEVRFAQAFCDELATNDKVIVYYTATLNENAVVSGAGNTNDTHLDYGEGNETSHDSTVTKTFGFDIVKTDSQNTLIDGAGFRIYDAATGGTEIPVVKVNETLYRRANAGENGDEIVVQDGEVRVEGFDNGTYYLEETTTPEGYNQLATRQAFTISDGNLDSIFNDGIYSTGSGVHVVNKSGTMLPETGGMGTMLFLTFGMFTVLATGVLLVTKKRMSMIEE